MSLRGIRSRFRSAAPDDPPSAHPQETDRAKVSIAQKTVSQRPEAERASFAAPDAGSTTATRHCPAKAEQTNSPANQTPPASQDAESLPGRRSRSSSLRRQVLDAQPTASPRSHRQRFLGRDKSNSDRSMSLDRSLLAGSVPCSSDENIDAIASVGHDETPGDGGAAGSPTRLQPHRRIAAWARELMDDLQSIDDACRAPNKDSGADDPSLAVKRLKNNIVRFGRATGALSSLVDYVQSLRQWESPGVSFLVVVVMLYAIWHGLFLALALAAILWRLTLNYLASRGWWSGGAPGTGDGSANDADDADKSSGGGAGVAERVASVVHVARKVQNHLGAVCDAAEKVKSLLLWRHEASRRLYTFVWAAFVLTLLVPSAILFRLVGFYLVFKLAVLDYVYFRFPRLREKYDTSPLMWDRLPTDAEWAAKRKAEQASQGGAFEAQSFRDSFNLPITENPLPGWQSGVKSSLVNRDKSLTSSFKTGRLFLTQNYLCFERSKTHPEKNIAIPLEKIERIEKSSQSSWMPGGGMIVEVIVQGCDRAFSFGALTNRDDVYDAVRSSAEKVARLIG